SDIYAGVVHMGVDMAIPTDGLGIGLTALPVVGPGLRGTRAAVQIGKQFVSGVERGLGRVLKVGAEALGESEEALQRLVQKFPSLSRGGLEVSYAGEFSRATASSLAREEATFASKPLVSRSAAPPPSAEALESMEFASLKVKSPPSAREIGRRYDAERRAARKAAFLESAKSTVPMDVKLSKLPSAPPPPSAVPTPAPPPSAAAQRFEGVGYGAREIVLGAEKSPIDAGIKWKKGIQEQGMPWEDHVGAALPPGSRLPKNYKTFDHRNRITREAISAKTLDTNTLSRITDPKKVYYSLKKSIDAAERFIEYKLDKVTLASQDISSRVVEVAVPTSTTPAQWEQILRAVEYAKVKGVILKITETL
ncbi:MAG: hypothetical protein JSR85_03820, partial [Proteobacteria bacterium]|nr:hypothetical protein [Pseudomonadota bacterium]